MQASSSVPADTTALDFCLRLARAHATVIRRLDTVLGGHHGLSFGDFMLLNHLSNAPGGRLRRVDLAERQGLTASGVTRTLLPLEKTGLIARLADERDARVGFAAITPAGHELLDNAMFTAREACAELLRHAPQEQLDTLTLVLGTIAGPGA
ncbi:MarR family winged helix-turn-helix transcriptional regulator [Pseudoduganella chitinolytica]|uniref:MarR family winged helix-turn-helix transcriptional regulator n=1 Tax=Pseudoduganella chitinolytica TaxID=34070 RepID=A0ABY8BHD4_9BURK|nr:MarR family winged helix-turn-helix transcriptional regulator [Pseudoduganella chitinolytica]WEF35260.1 MarR family winged helix-turn-helix transcriptional regulator [Pseudoduganella chitinolytica]